MNCGSRAKRRLPFVFAGALCLATAIYSSTVHANTYSAWSKVRKIFFNTTSSGGGANTSTHLTNHPVLIRLTASNFVFADAKSNGEDLRFDDPDGTVLSYQIERWDAGAQVAEIWVRVPQIDGNSSSDFIRMYWGNAAAADNSNSAATFRVADGFQGVYHFASANALSDSTGNGNNGTNTGTAEAAGVVGRGRSFVEDSWVNVAHSITQYCTECTLEAWYYLDVAPTSWNNSQPRIWDKGTGAASLALDRDGNDCSSSNPTLRFAGMANTLFFYGTCGDVTTTTGVWNHVAVTFGGGAARFYVNGTLTTTRSTMDSMQNSGASDVRIGNRTGNSDRDFVGRMDEVRMSNAARSADHIKFTYENTKATASCLIYGAVEANTGGAYSEWGFYRKITFNTTSSGANTSTNVTAFPLLIRLSSSNFDFSQAQAGGQDIRFADPDGTLLSYQIDDWDSVAQTASLWVRVPQIDANNNADFVLMYWGNEEAASESNPNDTFRVDDNYQAVYHFRAADSFLDATENANNGANTNTSQATGIVGYSRSFVDNSFVEVPHSATLHCSSCTIESWYYLEVAPGSWTNNQPRIWDKTFDQAPALCLDKALNGCSVSTPTFRLSGLGGSQVAFANCGDATTSTGVWNHVVVTYGSNTANFYVNGVLTATRTSLNSMLNTSTSVLRLGNRSTGTDRDFQGRLDEVRMSNVARSADYAKLTFETTKSTVTCLTYGSTVQNTLDRYWIGSAADTFSDAAKWSTTPGGANDVFAAPDGGNIVHFTNGTGGTISGTISVKGIELAHGFSGTINAEDATLTVGSEGFVMAGGTFSAPSGSMTINGPFTHTNGTFTHNSGVVMLGVESAITAGAMSFYTLTLDAALFSLATDLSVTDSLSLATGNVLDAGQGGHQISVGTITGAGGFTAGNSTVFLTGSGGGLPTFAYHNLTINNANASWTLGAALSVSGNLDIQAGGLDVSVSNHDVTVGGGFTNGGTFNARSGLVTFNGTAGSHSIVLGADTFHQMGINGSGGTWTLAGNLNVTNALSLTAGTFDTSVHDLIHSHAFAATVDGGSLVVSGGTSRFNSGLSLTSGALSFPGTGTLEIGSGSALSVSGGSLSDTVSASVSTIQVAGGSGHYEFTVTGGTVNVDGMHIKNTNVLGLAIANAVTITRLAHIEFSGGSNAEGSRYLGITKDSLDMFMEGMKFDDATTYNVQLVGNGDGDGGTHLTLQYFNTSINGPGAGEARDHDDDTDSNGVADDPNSAGAVVQWVTYYTDIAGDEVIGFPTPAFDWNTFEFYGTYVAIKDASGTSDRIYVRDADGASQGFGWDGPPNEDFIGAPRWSQDGSDRFVFVITTGGKVYKLRNTGVALEVVTHWPYTTPYAPTTSVGLGNDYLVWAANDSGENRYLQRLDHTAVNPDILGAASYQYSSAGSAVDAMTANPALSTIASTLYAFFAGKDRVYRLDVESWSAVLDGTTAATTQPNGRLGVFFSRVYFGDNEGKLIVKDAADNSLPTLWSYQATAPGGGGCAAATCRFVNLTVGFNLPDSVTYPRAYWGDASGRLFAVRQDGTGGALVSGFPMTLDSNDGAAISAAPLYFRGVVVVGNEGGDLFVVNQQTTAQGDPAVVQRYRVGQSISSVSRDSTNGRYIAVANGRLFYFPTYQDADGFR
jgi:hypothetical protein